jgi:hypothetical protein
MAQNFVVALLVGCCFVYALWNMAPKASRSRLAVALLKLPVPHWLRKPLLAASRQQGGCGGCGGCGGPVNAKASADASGVAKSGAGCQKPLTFVRGNYAGKTPL